MKGKKRKREEEEKKEEEDSKEEFRDEAQTNVPLYEVLLAAKKPMQSKTKSNGVTYALMGSSGCGKSFLLRKIFIEKLYADDSLGVRSDDKDYVVLLPTESPQSDQFLNMPEDIIVDGKGVDQEIIKWMYQMNEIHERMFNFVLMCDDCIHLKHKEIVEKCFLIMRNSNITSIISLQYPNLIPKSVRTSVYFIFCMHQNEDEGIEIMLEDFLFYYIPGSNKKEKIQYYRDWTRNHQFFIIDNIGHRVWKVNNRFFCDEMKEVRYQSSSSICNSTNPISKLNPTKKRKWDPNE